MIELSTLSNGEIELQSLQLKDAEALFHLTNENRMYLREWLPWVDATKTVDDTKKFIEGTIKETELGTKVSFGIYYQTVLVGVINFHQVVVSHKGSIGYWIAQPYQGKGIITNAVRLFIQFGFEVLHLRRIEIRCWIKNVRSCAVPERLGFTFEGTSRQAAILNGEYIDMKIYSLLSTDQLQ